MAAIATYDSYKTAKQSLHSGSDIQRDRKVTAQKPRLTFTPTPVGLDAVTRIAARTGVPASAILADFFSWCEPHLVAIADLYDATGLARAKLSDALAIAPPDLEIATLATAEFATAKAAVREAREILAAFEVAQAKPGHAAPGYARPGKQAGRRRR